MVNKEKDPLGKEPSGSSLRTLTEARGNIRNYLRFTSIDDPGVSMETLCYSGINLYVDFIIACKLNKNCPSGKCLELKNQIKSSLGEVLKKGSLERENFTIQNQGIRLVVPSDMGSRPSVMDFASAVLMRAAGVDERLVRFQYASVLTGEKNSLTEQSFTGFEWKYRTLTSMIKTEGTLTESRLMALNFLEQIAKSMAQESTKKQLKTLQPYKDSFSLTLVEGAEENYVNKKLSETLSHLSYLAIVRKKIEELAKMGGIDEEKIRLLKDVCFFHSESLNSGEWTKLISPIMKAIGENRYHDAYACRDFLLNQFLSCFPDWRQREIQKLNKKACSHKSITDFANKRMSRKLKFDDVPSDYLPLVSESNLLWEKLKQEDDNLYRKKVEEIRKKVAISELLCQTIIMIADRQNGQENIRPLDKNFKFPLNLAYRHEEQNVSISIIGFDKDENGAIGYVVVMDKKRSSFGSHRLTVGNIFLNLIEQGSISKEILDKAMVHLKKAGWLKESDNLKELLPDFLKKLTKEKIRALKQNIFLKRIATRIQTLENRVQDLTSSINAS